MNTDPDYNSYIDPSKVWTTYDLGLSAALLSKGYKLISVDKSNPRRSLFVFLNEDPIGQTAGRYFSNSLEVRAREFFDSLKALKNQLYSKEL